MPKVLSMKPTVKTFRLTRLDPSGETTVTIRQATAGDVKRVGDLFSEQTQIFDDGDGTSIKIQKKFNYAELNRYRAYLTLADCNIQREVETSDGKIVTEDWFKFVERNGVRRIQSEGDFYQAWDALPQEVVEEIVDYVLDVNPMWDPNAQGE